MSTTTNQSSVLYQLRKLMPPRALSQFEAYRIAELQANRLLAAFGVDQPGTPDELVTGQPFIQVVLRDDLPISGLTNWYKPRWLVVLNDSEPAVRRRFSLHHEFKHLLDHGLADRAYPSTIWQTNEERAERVADYFAACLLMPRRLVKRRFFEGLSDPDDLAAEFGVSPQAMRFRLQQLHLAEPRSRCGHSYRSTGDLTGYFRRASILELAA
jgi:predicted transcriptional regulator